MAPLNAIDLAQPPYGDPPAIVIYAFHKLAALAYDAATSPDWQPDGRLAAVKALATANMQARAASEAINQECAS